MLMQGRNLVKEFDFRGGGRVRAVNGVNIELFEEEKLGLVGESGSGKSTLVRCLLMLIPPTEGQVFFQGQNILEFNRKQLLKFRSQVQIVFQDPYNSLDPLKTVAGTIARPLKIHGIVSSHREAIEKVYDLMAQVGLDPDMITRFPHEFSGGQRQRIAIARALSVNPSVIFLDEPTSALDMSVQAQILNLLKKLNQKKKLSYLFISHNIHVVNFLCDRVGVMYCGRIVEIGPKETIRDNPAHPYTQCLFSTIPTLDADLRKERAKLKGEIPDPTHPPSGCYFHPRCPKAQKICTTKETRLDEIAPGHCVACHYCSV